MADIVGSLFGFSSQELMNQQRQNDQNFATNVANIYQDPGARIGALIGANLGGGLARGVFNIQDPQIKAAQDFEAALAEAQQSSSNPAEAMTKLAEKLGSDPRFSRQAAMAKMKAQELSQESALNQAKINAENAKASRETADKRPEVVKLLEAKRAYEALGETENVKAIDALLAKNSYIPEKEKKVGEKVDTAIYNKFLMESGGDETLAALRFDEYEQGKKERVAKAGVALGSVDEKFVNSLFDNVEGKIAPRKDKVIALDDALKLAAQATMNPQAATQLDGVLGRLSQEGKLSNSDIDRIISAGSFDQRVADSIQRFLKGVPSELSIGQKVEVLNLLKKSAVEDLNSSVERIKNVYGATSLPPKLINDALSGFTYVPAGSKPTPSAPKGKMNKTKSGISYQIVD